MRKRSKSSINDRFIAIVFFFMCVYGLLSNPSFVARIKVVVVYTLVLSILFVLATLTLRYIRRIKHQGLEMVDVMTGVEFEHYVAKLLVKQGFTHISLTERYDYGIDIIAEKGGIKWGIQVKRHNGLVKALAVRQVVTALKKYRCDRAIVISNSEFSRIAVELARTNDCTLIDRNKLLSWITA